MTPEATPPAIAGLIVLGILLCLAMVTAFYQTWEYDFSEPSIRPDTEWELDTDALRSAVTNTPETTPVELMEE